MSDLSKKRNIHKRKESRKENVETMLVFDKTRLLEDNEEEVAGGDRSLDRLLLPSVGESSWGPGRAGWAHCSSNSMPWHRDEKLHPTLRLHVALTYAECKRIHTI